MRSGVTRLQEIQSQRGDQITGVPRWGTETRSGAKVMLPGHVATLTARHRSQHLSCRIFLQLLIA